MESDYFIFLYGKQIEKEYAVIDINGNSMDQVARALSNFTARTFVFEGVECTCLEGILQALKCPDFKTQRRICRMTGRDAKAFGDSQNNWKKYQQLWWNGKAYDRSGSDYLILITRIYNTVYEECADFREALAKTWYEDLRHTIGKTDMRETVLTEVEMIYQLNRLRIRLMRETNTRR